MRPTLYFPAKSSQTALILLLLLLRNLARCDDDAAPVADAEPPTTTEAAVDAAEPVTTTEDAAAEEGRLAPGDSTSSTSSTSTSSSSKMTDAPGPTNEGEGAATQMPIESIGQPHKMCKNDSSADESMKCHSHLACVDYSALELGHRCEYEAAPDPKTCRPMEPVEGYLRWVHQTAEDAGKAKWKTNAPANGWKMAGCYLEKGEICKMMEHKSAMAEPHHTCKLDHGCFELKNNWGFCKFNSSPRLFTLSSLALVWSTSSILLIWRVC